ncbi:hypothetical protein CEUSTIGMA_g5186.t1 [Chlamydomonas eustigma]|uniref:Peptidase C1A papain C-terminal domain-containing protein n=1 Tax=Chlamydomonas eustigma TaxID=1157962 RepID=A0A250X3T8_9CHLO|nr:hypothetical protein CEUSTIGMA_g5186.t1 [Chlamydomonas eustigma]|eukprot:GAX77743.1 hypothetical protein CEUSTIGMA_g5186.t1 [Chlamydomonas eustigma]
MKKFRCHMVLALIVLAFHINHAARVFDDVTYVNDRDTPEPPKWSDAYMIEFVLTLPQYLLMQPQGLSIPMKAWFDGQNNAARIESYGGVDSVYFLGDTEYDIHPRIDKLKCYDFPSYAPAKTFLPNLQDSWNFVGRTQLDGKSINIWQRELVNGEVVSTYTIYTNAADGAPLKFHIFSTDEYIYDFKSYKPFQSMENNPVFKLPSVCKKTEASSSAADPNVSPQNANGSRHWLSLQMSMLMPAARISLDSSWSNINDQRVHLPSVISHAHWSSHYGQGLHNQDFQEVIKRMKIFQSVYNRVMTHNANPNKTYTMHLGRFADWTEEEYYGMMLPDVWRRKQGLPSLKVLRREEVSQIIPGAYDPISKFKRSMKKSDLPKEVSWQGTGADPGVKDQGMCGSCWSFGATGAMEGSWYVQTGQRRSFSEQHLMECAFDWGPRACDGGDARPAINYVAHNGGIAIEQDYFYHMTVDYCRATNHTPIGHFEGFLEIESRDEEAFMEAVYRFGPISVAMDASLDSFAYYKEGVYLEKECSNYELDHQVLLYGYGTTESGQDYWLVKNSWSKLYGTDGFIKVARGHHDCGITTESAVAVVPKAFEAEGKANRCLEAVRRWS